MMVKQEVGAAQKNKKINTTYTKPLQRCEGFFYLKFLFRADMLAQHRLLKIVKGEKNINVCQMSAKIGQNLYKIIYSINL